MHIGGTEVEKNIIFEGVLICDSIAVWQSTALSIDFRGALGNTPLAAGGVPVVPARVYGALAISEATAQTTIAIQGTHVRQFGYKRIGELTSKFGSAPIDLEFETNQWPWRREESRQNHDQEQGWKLADDGRVSVRDSRIGFDLVVAGTAARSKAKLAARLDERLRTACENGVELEGITIGGDLDLRGLKTGRDVRAENIRVQGHVRVGLESLLRELRDRGRERDTDADSNAIQTPAGAVVRDGEGAAAGPAGSVTGQRSSDLWWMEPEEAGDILRNARTNCRRFLMRSSRVEGDVRLDGLTARADHEDTDAGADIRGSVAVHACVIRGDLSFAIKNGPASDEQFVITDTTVAEAEKRPNEPAHVKEKGRRHTYVLGTEPQHSVPAYTHIEGGLDLTQSSCGHLLISGICFEAIEKDEWDLAPVRFHAFSTDRFELLDSPISRDCDLNALNVASWDIREDRFVERRDEEPEPIDLLIELLKQDSRVPRNTYTSVERSLLDQGEVDDAEEVRKQMWEESAKKQRNLFKYALQMTASEFGYGGYFTLFSPLLLFVGVSIALSFYVAVGLQEAAFEPSLLRSIELGEAPFVLHPTPGYLDAVLVAARATLPGLGLLVAEDYRASVEPWFFGVSMNHIIDLVSVVGWVLWLLTAVVISLRVFRSAGLRARQ